VAVKVIWTNILVYRVVYYFIVVYYRSSSVGYYGLVHFCIVVYRFREMKLLSENQHNFFPTLPENSSLYFGRIKNS